MEMKRLSCIIIILPILFSSCFFQNKLAIARTINTPLHVYKISDKYMQWSCANVLKEIEKEIGNCGLYSMAVRATLQQIIAPSSPISHETLITLPVNFEEDVLLRFCKYYQIYQYLHKHACSSHVTLLLHNTNIYPRRSLADKLPKASSPSSDSTSDDSIIIPPDLLFQSPQPQPEADRSSLPSTSKEGNNKDLIIIIVIAGSIAGVAFICAIVVFCWLIRGSRSFGDKQRDDTPPVTLSSSDVLVSGSSSNNDDIGSNTSGHGPNQHSDGQQGTSLPSIPENGVDAAGNSEIINVQNGQSNLSPPPAPPPAPAFKPKAPPPPPKGARPPPAPPFGAGKGPHQRGQSTSGDGNELSSDPDGSRTKLKPFFWDKVVGSPDHSMVWDEIRAGSFQFNEERIESLFGYNPDDKRNIERRGRSSEASQPQQIQIIDPKKSQNLSILLKALNVTTEEVSDALLEGNELPTELLQTLLRMAPTQEEELKLRLFDGDLSLLGPAERFLKVLVDIPLAFKRMESLMFMMTYKEEVSNIKESFVTLEVACDEVKKSRLFLKLLEAVLKTGNRMNDGTYRGGAQAFKLDTLLKLADVKGTDGKTTLLHFVVQEIIKAEGLKAMRSAKENRSISSLKSDDFVEDADFDETQQFQTVGLEIVSHISSELENVKKAAIIDADGLTITVSKLGQSLTKIKNFLSNEMDKSEEETGFYLVLVSFRDHSEGEVEWLVKEERRISELVRKTADYFHGNAGREEGLRLFSIVRDFLVMLDQICAQLKQTISKPVRSTDKNTSPELPTQNPRQSMQEMRQRLFPMIAGRRADDSGSGSESD